MNLFDIIVSSFRLIFSFDSALYEIIILSLYVSISALIISSLFGLATGFLISSYNFNFKSSLLVILNALMGIPPVVVGLGVYLLFAKGGSLGVFDLIYTPYAMIVAQSIIIFPIISSLSYEFFKESLNQYDDHFRSMNIPLLGRFVILFRNGYFVIMTVLMAGFGRAISEVGAIMIVGGNIEHHTRAMTTAISLETRRGNLDYAMALGIILILLTFLINAIIYIFNINRGKEK